MDGEDERLGKIGAQRLHAVHLYTHVNAFAERWVRSIKNECLSKLILFGEASLRRAVTQFLEHYHFERPHQGKGKSAALPVPHSATITTCWSHPMPRASRRSAQVLSTRRMNILTLRQRNSLEAEIDL
jgi:hypothetical protein